MFNSEQGLHSDPSQLADLSVLIVLGGVMKAASLITMGFIIKREMRNVGNRAVMFYL